MANNTEEAASVLFVEKAKYWFERTYPNWREVFNASPEDEFHTICIPDALDILPNRRLETEHNLAAGDERATKRNFVGQRAEDIFFNAFRQLKLGGILICGFETQEFSKIMNQRKVSDFDFAAWKKDSKHFECDAIFLHQNLGAYIIEAKGCKNDKVKTRLNQAANQLKRSINGMTNIYRQLTGENFQMTFRGVIVIPNAVIRLAHDTYKVFGKFEIGSADFRQYWLLPRNEETQDQPFLGNISRELISDDIYTFLATIIGYRSAKFYSMPSNALEIYQIIDKQRFTKIKKQNIASERGPKLQPADFDAIILNSEQLSAVECSGQHIVISGPPGTGKTTVMLLRALQAAKLEKPGRVVIVSGLFVRNNLKSLFRKFVEDNWSDQWKRKITVTGYTGNLLCDPDNLQDDLFFDEMPVDKDIFSELIEQQHEMSPLVTGTTTIVLTGWINPQNLALDLTAALSFFPNFHHIELKTVIRGTHSVIDEWRRFYPDRFFIIGHNVKGTPVERIAVNDRSQLLAAVEQKVESLLNAYWNRLDSKTYWNSLDSITPQHLAILVSFKKYNFDEQRALISDIKFHLEQKKISCGDIKEQVKDIDPLIAVDNPRQALSFDWPTVIYIRGDSMPDDLIAFSRCISKLIIIEMIMATDVIEKQPAIPLSHYHWSSQTTA